MTSPPSSLLPVPPPWWKRLHTALMPDYNRPATAFWWTVVLAGGLLLLGCLVVLAPLGWQGWLQIVAGTALAMAAGLFPVRVPGAKQSFVASEIFIFLLLLVLGPAAAAVAAATEAFVGSYRTSKRWTSRIASPAIATLSVWSVGTLLQTALAALKARGLDSAAAVMAAAMAFAALFFVVNVLLVSGAQRLKRGEAFFQWAPLFTVFRWVGIAYAGSASVAALLYVTWREQGAGVLMVMVPLLAMLGVTLHFYFRQQEANEAMREAHAGAAEREAALSAEAAEAAARHLRELQASEHRFHAAFTHASIGMAVLDFSGRILQANRALAGLLALREDELQGQRLQRFVLDEDRAGFEHHLGLRNERRADGRHAAGHGALRGAQADFEAFSTEVRCRAQDGQTVWVALHCNVFTEPDAEQPSLILQAQDVTARRLAEAGLQHLAYHDSLTGLPNRRRFMECLAGAVARHQADVNHHFAVMFLDFDRFKLVNDSLGHNTGDALLGQMARRIQENLRPSDIVARLGGDEFAILAEGSGQEHDTIAVAERLKSALQRPFMLDDAEVVCTASIGITFSAFGYASAEEVLRDADTAMYKAKGSGRAGWALFDASLHTAVSDRLRLEGELRHAIGAGELAVVYQPLFELASGRLEGFEALVRWNHPRQGELGPAAFLPMAEESGLMLALSDFVLHCACQQLSRWQHSAPELAGLTMSVNVSAGDLAQSAFVARVSRALIEAGLRPEHLTLELTEGILMSQIGGAMETLAALKRLGVQLAVDDFGTGYSSLSHLSKLPIDSLKIDRSFVSSLRPGTDEAAVVQAIIQLGAALRKSVVAEGIESAEQMDQLRAMGCGFGQGFHLGTPLSLLEAGDLLRRRPPVALH
jgi:diguanylate cyclase (GGDEF)-like protein/PAS domain S-box-containing protein